MSTLRKQALLLLLTLFHASLFSNQYPLLSEIETLLSKSPLANAYVGICVQDLDSKEILLEKNKSNLFTPASVTKLFTTAIALHTLGEDFCFETCLYTNSYIDSEGTLAGDLFLTGNQDPSLTYSSLDLLAKKIFEQGIRTVEGNIYVDPTKPCQNIPNAEWDDLMWYYAPPINTICLNKNQIKISINPGLETDELATISSDQKVPYYKLINQLQTVSSDNKTNLDIGRDIANRTITVSGTISKTHTPISEKLAIDDPAEYTRLYFIEALEKNGVRVKNTKQFLKINPDCQKKIATIKSTPLTNLIRTMNKNSDNLFAEQVYLRTLDSSEFAFSKTLTLLKISEKNIAIYNGSGLSRHNLISPNDTLRLLTHMYESSYKNTFIDSLPIAGKDGTLQNRFIDTIGYENIRAKTGTMSGISALAGYATTKQGRNISFCIFINNANTKTSSNRILIDEMIIFILNSL